MALHLRQNPTLGGQQSYTNSIGYGVTPWWKIELEGESESVPDSSVHYSATTIENTFQLTPPGKYMLNLGFFAEYSQSALNGEPNSFTAGPIVQKELFDFLGVDSLHTLNVFLSHDVGHNATRATGLQVAWQSRLLLNRTSIRLSSYTASSMTWARPARLRSSSISSVPSCWAPSVSRPMAR